jgi:predicted nucleic acid-binding protein
VLDKLFDTVCIPQAVFSELIVPDKPHMETITEWAKGRIVPVKNTVAVAAFSLNLDPGTIGIRLSAKQKAGIAEVKPSLDILVNTGFRMSDILHRQILERAGEQAGL